MQSTAARIPERWINPIRVGTALIVLLHLALFALAIPARFDELTQPCVPELCEPLEPTEADILVLDELGLSLNFYATYHIGLEVVLVLGSLLLIGVLFWRASSLWIGILAILGMIQMATMVANVIYALGESNPEFYPLFVFAGAISTACMLVTFYVFPDGRFYPRWTKIPVAILLPFLTVTQYSTGGQFIDNASPGDTLSIVTSTIGLGGLLILGLVTQVIRYRRYYGSLQKQQTRWLIVAIAGIMMGVIGWFLLFEFTLIPPGPGRMLASLVGMAVLTLFTQGLLIFALAIAILRYRLWDIDLIIRRTVMYSAITALLAGVYFGVVTLLQSGFVSITGQESPLAVVASTLAIAALFNPVRVRVQNFLDRRFNRRRYNAEQTLEAFAEAMRDDVDMDHLSAALVGVVEETMQPESVGLWIK